MYTSIAPVPPVDGETLRSIMRNLAWPVVVVTGRLEDEVRGMTASSFTSVSLTPPLISLNVRTESRMAPVLAEGTHFAVHLLDRAQDGFARHFARPHEDGEAHLAGLRHRLHPLYGLPLLEDTLGVLCCRREQVFETGDHLIIIGQVCDVQGGRADRPLLYFQRSYRSVDDGATADGALAA